MTQRTRAIIGIILMLIILAATFAFWSDIADADELIEAYVICARGDYVNIRPFPNRKGEPIGRFETGDTVLLDGKQKNGFLHCVDLSLEAQEGWINKGYVVYDKPEPMNQNAVITCGGRLAARKCVNGKRTRWLKSGASVKVWYWSSDWCVTNCGYVMTKYLELEGE